MTRGMQIPEMGAEMLLNYLYPELQEQWIAYHDGTFYRNYSRDVLHVNKDGARVHLSRDGILALLPQGLISPEDELKTGDVQEKHNDLEWNKKLLSQAFLPFDSLAFRRQLRIEREVSQLLNDKLRFLLKTYFGYDWDAEQNPYVREMAPLLLYVRQRRGDFGLVKNLLSSLFCCPVKMVERRYSEQDSTQNWLPEVRYELLIPGLSPEAFRALWESVQGLQDFLAQWLIPMEVRLQIVIKQHQAPGALGGEWVLDYNTEL